jgi:hypothetical protein
VTNFLAYGAIGLGLALAVLAYRLLSKEQQRTGQPRAPLLNAIYVFMGFTLLLAAGGFAGEYLKGDAAQISAVRAELKSTAGQLKDLQGKHDKMREGLNVSRAVVESLLDLKGGKVARLKRLDQRSPEYFAMVNEIQMDLEKMDTLLRAALKK